MEATLKQLENPNIPYYKKPSEEQLRYAREL